MFLKISVLVVVMVGFEQVVIYCYVGFPFSYSSNLHEGLAEFYADKSARSPPHLFSHPSPPHGVRLRVVLQPLLSHYKLWMIDELM